MDMTIIAALSWALKIATAGVAAVAVVWTLRWLDKRAGIDFQEFARDLREDAGAAALYLGLRAVAIALAMGLVLGLG